MCCNNRVARDFMKNFEKSNREDGRKGSQFSSSSESGRAYDQDAVRSLDHFRERHLLKVQRLIQKSTKGGDARKTRKASSFRRPIPIYAGARPPTFLERQLLPTIKTDDANPFLACEKSEAAQLTIFYKGAINVYDNISADKAKAIMLLAGESSLKVPPTKDKAEQEASKPIRESNPTSNLPIASRRSLMAFFDKRRDRIMNNSSYASP